ncbi:hypothetical protein NHX12_020028, partial [Muraenolepis orangiensis]
TCQPTTAPENQPQPWRTNYSHLSANPQPRRTNPELLSANHSPEEPTTTLENQLQPPHLPVHIEQQG